MNEEQTIYSESNINDPSLEFDNSQCLVNISSVKNNPDWEYTTCEETYFQTLSGKWHNIHNKIWETLDGKLYKIDRQNFITECLDPAQQDNESQKGSSLESLETQASSVLKRTNDGDDHCETNQNSTKKQRIE